MHTTIIAEAIKLKHPDCKIDFLTLPACVALLKDHPCIDETIIWENSYKDSFKDFINIALKLFKKRYDCIFSPSRVVWTTLLSIFALPKKIIFNRKLGGLWVDDYFQMAQRVFKDLEKPEKLTLGLSKEAVENIETELKKYAEPYFVIAPGRVMDNLRQGRLWNIDKWKELSQMLTQRYGGTVFVIGNKKEREKHIILSADNVIIKSGEYSIEESNALFSKATLMISGDTGPVHMASACGAKTLALLGSTSPKQIKPYGKNGYYVSAEYDCLHCWRKKCKRLKEGEIYTPCMEALSANTVMKKVEEILTLNKE